MHSAPYTVDQVAESLEQYAILHGRTWGSVGTDELWLAPRLDATMRARGLAEISGNFDGPNGSRVPKEVRDAEQLMKAVGLLARLLDEGGATMPTPRRRTRRESVPRCRRTSLPR